MPPEIGSHMGVKLKAKKKKKKKKKKKLIHFLHLIYKKKTHSATVISKNKLIVNGRSNKHLHVAL